MTLISLRKLSYLVCFPLVSSKPIPTAPNEQHIADALQGGQNPDAVMTTVTIDNIIDWIPIECQGTIASPPPPRAAQVSTSNTSAPIPDLQQPGVELGPLARIISSYRLSSSYLLETQFSGDHWYVTSDQSISNIGGSAIFSVFHAFVENNDDFSLLQTAVTKSNVPLLDNPSQTVRQTVEAGWINYPAQVSSPHLFTVYTTNGYTAQGNNIGGWDRDQSGWVQVDSTIFPGTVFAPDSAIGGAQNEIEIAYELFQGNWWLFVLDRWIGYYPASLFSANQAIPAATLADGSDTIFYYGEVFQTESALTTTGMGSGEFGSTGFGYAAYIHNMMYMDPGGNQHSYTASFGDSDSSRYSHSTTAMPAGNWGSYVYLGGPGAGGVVGD